MRVQKWLSWGVLLAFLSVPLWPALAQVVTASTATTSVTLDQLLNESKGVVSAFKVVGVLAGIAAAVNLLVTLTKYGPVNGFIVRKNAKWIRPVLALLAGLLSGVVAALAKGLPVHTAVLYSVGGLISGGGAIAMHELWLVLKGDT